MTEEQTRVANLIRDAFQGVVLDNGVGLFQAKAIDDHRNEKFERQKDEKLDWTKIPSEHLQRCYSSLCFFDAEGIRFHLPAYIIADLEGTYLNADNIVFTLCSKQDSLQSRFDLLNPLQRRAIQEYLLLCRDEKFLAKYIDRALQDYWTLDTIE